MKNLILAAALVCLAACSPAKKAETPERVTIRFATDWRAEAEHGGFYEALANGEYAKRGLDVKIIQGGPSVNVPQLLAANAVEMGVGSNTFIPLNMAKEGVPVRAVAAIMQKDPQVLIAHPEAGIKGFEDMKGRPILLSDASVTGFWQWLKAKYGFTDAQVRKYENSAPFLQDKRAIQQGYVTSEPYTIEKASGMKPAVFLLADAGYPGYSTMILASDKVIAEKPEAVRAFVEASAAGWKAYLNGDPKPADTLILKDNPDMTQDLLDHARAEMKARGIVESGDALNQGIGAMSDARWAAFFKAMADQGVYPQTMDFRKAYTLQFVTPR